MTNMNMTIVNSQASNTSGNTEVIIVNYGYAPAELTVTVGTTVTWINKDPIGHTVTEGNPASPKPSSGRLFDSSHGTEGANVIVIPPGQSWSYTFNKLGTYDYYCIPHPYMKGRVIVLSSGSGGQQGSGYGDFTVILTGKEIYAMSAFGLVALVGLMIILSKSHGKGD